MVTTGLQGGSWENQAPYGLERGRGTQTAGAPEAARVLLRWIWKVLHPEAENCQPEGCWGAPEGGVLGKPDLHTFAKQEKVNIRWALV